MRVIYICRCCLNSNSGVNKKIFMQYKNMKNLNINCKIFCICANKNNYIQDSNVINVQIPGIENPNGVLKKINREHYVNIAIREIISQTNYQEIIYLRIPFPSFEIVKTFKKIRKGKIIIEYQTIEKFENKLLGNYWYLFLDFLFGSSIRKYSDAIVGVTSEITQYQLKRCKNFNKPHITIGNGIDVVSVPVRQLTNALLEKIHLLFVANVSRWHGIDRFIRGIYEYKNKNNICLHIVGEGKDISNLKKLVDNLHLSKQVIFHGFKTGEELDSLFNSCYVAVGSLGLHRIGLNESSTLKVREYCARGIPYIITCGDPDFPDDFPYIFRVPPDESPIDIESVIHFAQKVCSEPDHSQKMRKYAEENLDWSIKMKKLKGFLESLIEDPSSNT